MSIKTTNEKAGQYAKRLQDFEASNLKGETIEVGDYKSGLGVVDYKTYIITSYNTIILANVNGVWYENTSKYSRTTSKQKTQLKYYIDIDEERKEDQFYKEVKDGGLYGQLQAQLKTNGTITKGVKI